MPFQLEHSKHGGLYFENTAALWGPKSHLRTNDLWVLLFLFISCATGFNAVANSLPRGQSKWELHPLQGGMPLGIPRAWGAWGCPPLREIRHQMAHTCCSGPRGTPCAPCCLSETRLAAPAPHGGGAGPKHCQGEGILLRGDREGVDLVPSLPRGFWGILLQLPATTDVFPLRTWRHGEGSWGCSSPGLQVAHTLGADGRVPAPQGRCRDGKEQVCKALRTAPSTV